MKTKADILASLQGGLIASCQVKKDDPQYIEGIIAALAKGAIAGGAVGLRINEPENIKAVRAVTDLPIIGLWKIHRDDTDVFMTPNMDAVKAVIEAGADIVAIDGTNRMIDGEAAYEIIPRIKQAYPNVLIFADVRDDEDAVGALQKGADIVAPTFYRFSPNAKSSDIPDWEMFSRMCDRCKDKGAVFMEGKIWTPDDCIRALHYGAHAVVVGTVLTRVNITTQRFVDHIKGFKEKRSLFY